MTLHISCLRDNNKFRLLATTNFTVFKCDASYYKFQKIYQIFVYAYGNNFTLLFIIITFKWKTVLL
jgi:hypothetical protein